MQNRLTRHIIFWMAWVFGFTFIKSFGYGFEVYAGWLVYYLVTLPIFVVHTILIVYWAAGKFLKGYKILLFAAIFVVSMMLFSFLELLITDSWLSGLFPMIFADEPSYLDPANVLISGVGNLYVLLVFAAARITRNWYLGRKREKEVLRMQLNRQRADVNAGIQPGFLLYAISRAKNLSWQKDPVVPEIIAQISVIMNRIMSVCKQQFISLNEEISIIRQVSGLYALLDNKGQINIDLEPGANGMMLIRPLTVYSPVEILMRHFKIFPAKGFIIRALGRDEFSIFWQPSPSAHAPGWKEMAQLNKELEALFPGQEIARLHQDEQGGMVELQILLHDKVHEMLLQTVARNKATA